MHILLIDVGGGGDALVEPVSAEGAPGDLRISVVHGVPDVVQALADEHDLVLLDLGSGGGVEERAVAALRPLAGDRPLVLRASGDALRKAAGAASRVDAVLPAHAVAPGDLRPLLEGVLARHRRQSSVEARLAELEERVRTTESARLDLQAIVDATPGLFLVLTPDDFRIVAASDAYLEATHLRRDQALGRDLFDLFPDDPLEPDADGVRNLRLSLQRVVETGRADAMAVQRYPVRRVGGSDGEFEERFWSPVNAPVLGPGGALRFVVHRVEDVTEYVQARRAAGEVIGEGGEGFDPMEADLFLRAREIQELNHRLARSEQRVRGIFEAVPVGFAVLDPRGHFLYANPAFCRMLGRSLEEVCTLDFRAVTHPDDLDASEEVNRSLREGKGRHLVSEKRYLRPDGSAVWARTTVSAAKDRQGRAHRLVAVAEDITAERIVLQRLMENERLLTMAGRMAELGGWTVDLASGSLHWSDQVCAIHGVPPGTRVTAEEGMAFYAPEWRPVIHDAFERCIREGAPFDLDLEIVVREGRRVWVRAVGEAVRDADGNVIRVQGAFQDISERKRAEAEIQASERRFRELAESMPLIVWRADHEGKLDYITGAMSRYAGVPARDLLGEAWLSMVHPDDVERCVEVWGRSISTAEPYQIEFRLRRADGVYRWHLVRAIPVRDRDGGVIRWYGSATDIDDLRTTTLKLRESEERFRSVARVTSDVLWDWDLTTDALWWGDGFQETFGFEEGGAETDISSWTSRIHPGDLERVEEGLRRAWESEETEWWDEYRFRRAHGSYARVRDRGRIVRDGSGRAIRMLGGISDESESLESRARLLEPAELLDLARDAIIVRDLDLTIAYWNAGAERIYGWARDEVLGRRSEEFLETEPGVCTEALDACLRDGEWARELEQRRKDGSTVEIEARWTLVRDSAGEPRRILSIHTDITERRKLMAQFLRAQRLESIGTLAGGIAHDLNNVLSPILMSIALLKLDLPEDEGLQEILSTIEGSARRGAEMVKQVLGFARGVEGQRLHVDLVRILDDLGRVVRDTFPRGITFRKEVPADLWNPWGDPTQIHQVMMNLLVNARDAMPGGGTLVILAENVRLDESYAAMSAEANPGRYVRVSVRDSGTGMPPEVMERMFDPFFTTKGVGQGTGLGLSTVQAILRSHGGFVNVYSEPGKGTTFRIHLPTERGEGTETGVLEQATPAGAAPRGNGELVLVVDDEPAVRDITRQALEASGYRVVTASDGAEAVALCGRMAGEVAVVLTDLMMPIMDGPSTVRALRHIDPGLRIVASSGLAVGEGVEQVTEAGVRYFLPKPYTAESLLHTLHRALRDD